MARCKRSNLDLNKRRRMQKVSIFIPESFRSMIRQEEWHSRHKVALHWVPIRKWQEHRFSGQPREIVSFARNPGVLPPHWLQKKSRNWNPSIHHQLSMGIKSQNMADDKTRHTGALCLNGSKGNEKWFQIEGEPEIPLRSIGPFDCSPPKNDKALKSL